MSCGTGSIIANEPARECGWVYRYRSVGGDRIWETWVLAVPGRNWFAATSIGRGRCQTSSRCHPTYTSAGRDAHRQRMPVGFLWAPGKEARNSKIWSAITPRMW